MKGRRGGKWGRGGGGTSNSYAHPPPNRHAIYRRIFHTCHCLYHIPFIPPAVGAYPRLDAVSSIIASSHSLTFPHVPPPHLVLTRVSRRCVRITVTVSSAATPALSPLLLLSAPARPPPSPWRSSARQAAPRIAGGLLFTFMNSWWQPIHL